MESNEEIIEKLRSRLSLGIFPGTKEELETLFALASKGLAADGLVEGHRKIQDAYALFSGAQSEGYEDGLNEAAIISTEALAAYAEAIKE